MSTFDLAAPPPGNPTGALPAISAAVGVICLIFAVLNVYVGKNHWPKLTVALVLTGATGLLNATIGSTIHRAINNADAASAKFVGGLTGVVVTGVLSATLFGYLLFRLKHKQFDKRTYTVTALVPATVTLIPGTVGTIATTVVGIVPAFVAGIVGWAFGVGG
jgi:hypothetical protein